MKPQLTRSKKLPVKPTDGEVSLSFRDELVATIHGAFGVAVDIAVLEVTKLVGEAMAELRGRMQRENEALKQRLRSAEAKLDSVRRAASPVPRRSDASDPDSPVPRRSDALDPDSPVPRRSDALDPEEEQTQQRLGCFRDICQNGHMHSKELGDPACREPAACDALLKEPSEEVPTSPDLSCQEPAAEAGDSPPLLPRGDDKSALEQVTIKEEKPVELEDGSSCCFDSLGVEDFGPDSLSLVQSKMLEEWKPDLLDIQSQDPNALMPCTSLALAHPPNMTASVPSADDLPSLSSEFPNIFQPSGDAAPVPKAASQVYVGVHLRSCRANPGQPAGGGGGCGGCKICGQTFQQPSLLRRHYGQCQQKLQQRSRQPTVGTKRTKLQLYPPGCSPFRCTECNREFNRLENLKTHLRIHTGERPYTCSVCSKCFRHSGALTRHFRIHTGEKPYVCGQCGKTFRNCGGLKFHQRSHNRQGLTETGF